MQQTLQTFYQNLDQYYAAGDVDQMERFLLETEAQYRKNTAGAAQIGIAVYNELGSLYRGISRYDAFLVSARETAGGERDWHGQRAVCDSAQQYGGNLPFDGTF